MPAPDTLALCFVALAALTDAGYALVAALVSGRLRGGARGRRRLAATSAGTYGALGVLALAG